MKSSDPVARHERLRRTIHESIGLTHGRAQCSAPTRAAIACSTLLAGMHLFVGCKEAKTTESNLRHADFRQNLKNSLPPIDVGSRDEDASSVRLVPEASYSGSFVLEVAGQGSCLGIRVAQDYLLSAASCVVDMETLLPRPAYSSQVLNSLVWQRENEKVRADFATLAVYPHPSFVEHFQTHTGSDRFEASESLAQVFDLVLLRILPDKLENLPPIVELSRQDPDGITEAIALQGHCKGTDAKDLPALDGGRILTEADWQQNRMRNSFKDSFSNPRALFDCEGFIGAPVLTNGPEPQLIGLTSWMQPGEAKRNVTKLSGSADQSGTVSNWIHKTISNPPPYEQSGMNWAVGCTRVVSSAIGEVRISIQPFQMLLRDGLIENADLTVSIETTIMAPPEDLLNANSPPLIQPGSEGARTFTSELIRDIRQPSIVQYVARNGEKFGDEKVTVSLVSTDRRTLLAVLSAVNQKTENERTLNIFFDAFDQKWCLLLSLSEN
jgi:hypothetical protein